MRKPPDYFYLNNKNIKALRNPTDGTMSYEDAARIRAMPAPLRVELGTERTMSIKQDIDTDRILKEVKKVDEKYDWRKPGNCQIMLQGCGVTDDPYFGSREFIEIESAGKTEEDFIIPLFKEMKYTNKILKELKMFRSRLMLLLPKTCLSWHKDPSMRIHIPLSGDSDSVHIIEDIRKNKQVHQIAKGEAHLMNTEVMHSGVNLSRKVERLHIVGCVNVD